MRSFATAGIAGFVIVLFIWWIGSGLVATEPADEWVTTAQVTSPARCTADDPVEKVRFDVGDKQRTALLHACGHTKGEQLEVAVPESPGKGALTVREAETEIGHGVARRSLGLLLVALACVGGGVFAFLLSPQAAPVGRTGHRHAVPTA